jgi:hypothetical protein
MVGRDSGEGGQDDAADNGGEGPDCSKCGAGGRGAP